MDKRKLGFIQKMKFNINEIHFLNKFNKRESVKSSQQSQVKIDISKMIEYNDMIKKFQADVDDLSLMISNFWKGFMMDILRV